MLGFKIQAGILRVKLWFCNMSGKKKKVAYILKGEHENST
jgi:hypothetical protein